MILADDIIAEARTWLDTPFVKQQRLRGVGVDCIGLIVAVAQALGIPVQDRRDYPLRPNGQLKAELDRQLVRAELNDLRSGDVLLMAFNDDPHHVAIYTGESLIHTVLKFRRCLEQPFDGALRARVRGVYRFPGVAWPS